MRHQLLKYAFLTCTGMQCFVCSNPQLRYTSKYYDDDHDDDDGGAAVCIITCHPRSIDTDQLRPIGTHSSGVAQILQLTLNNFATTTKDRMTPTHESFVTENGGKSATRGLDL